jgi:hypothetical protein
LQEGDEGGENALDEAMDAGFIRYHPGRGGFEMNIEPTEAQYSQLEKLARLAVEDGNRAKFQLHGGPKAGGAYFSITKPAEAKAVPEKIRAWYQHGKTPYESPLKNARWLKGGHDVSNEARDRGRFATTEGASSEAPKLDRLFDKTAMSLPTSCSNTVHTKDELYAKANPTLEDFDSSMDHGGGVDKAIGGKAVRPTDKEALLAALKEKGPAAVIIAPLKGADRAVEKVEAKYGGDYGRLTDVVRGTVAVDKANALESAIKGIHDEMTKTGWTLAARPEDRISTPCPGGYRDAVLKYRNDKGIVAEILVSTKAMILEKNTGGHKLYEERRSIDAKAMEEKRPKTEAEVARCKELDEAMATGYNNAWKASGGKV